MNDSVSCSDIIMFQAKLLRVVLPIDLTSQNGWNKL